MLIDIVLNSNGTFLRPFLVKCIVNNSLNSDCVRYLLTSNILHFA